MGTIWQPSLDGLDGPKYQAVVQAIRQAVQGGALMPGDRLPPVRELAWRLSITPGTVARAYSILTEAGELTAAVGRGTFVARPAAPPPARFVEADGPVRLTAPSLPDIGQVTVLREIAERLGRDGFSHDLLRYPSKTTLLPLRTTAVRWLADSHLGPLDPEDVVLTHGGQNAALLVMQSVLRGPRPVVLVEDLLYPGFRRAAELMRADAVAVPMDDHGVIPEALEDAVRTHDAQLLCTSPEVHNPTTHCTPLARRKAIASVARRTGLQLLEDDCYRMGPIQFLPYRALLPEQVWYIRSLSKLLSPALRVGFALAPVGKAAQLRRTAEYSYFGLSGPLADMADALLNHPRLAELSAGARAVVNDYIRAAVNILGGHDLTWRDDVPFLWLHLPAGWRASAFCQQAEAMGVQVRSADEYALRDGRAPHAIRISINARLPQDRFETAVQQLRTLLDNPPEHISV